MNIDTQLSLVIISGIACVLYLMAALGPLLSIFRELPSRYLKFSLILGYAAIVLHAWLLHEWIDVVNGQNLDFANMLSLAVWLVSVFILIFTFRYPLINLSLLIFPIAAFSIILATCYQSPYLVNTATNLKGFIHIILSVFAFSVMCLGALQAILLAQVEYLLRIKQPGPLLKKLPSLQMSERLLFKIVWLGFILLSLVIISSIAFYHEEAFSALLQKTVLAFFAWIVFAVLLVGRHWLGWRGRRAIYITLVGTGLLIIVYLGSGFFLGINP